MGRREPHKNREGEGRSKGGEAEERRIVWLSCGVGSGAILNEESHMKFWINRT